jgi:tRNA dimethylallyltransferase
MIEEGFIDEARSLYGLRELNSLNTVGYKELFDHFDGIYSLEETIERIKGNTRRYARKQLTWFKRDPEVKWFHPDNVDEIINYISQQIG